MMLVFQFSAKFAFCFCFQCRFVIKYRHCDGQLKVKFTDDQVVSEFFSSLKLRQHDKLKITCPWFFVLFVISRMYFVVSSVQNRTCSGREKTREAYESTHATYGFKITDCLPRV